MVQVMPTEVYFAQVKQTLQEKGQAFVRVTGDSMRPLLRHMQDGVIIVPVEQIRRGDVVLFDRKTGRYALHRVMKVQGDHFKMIGDNQWRMDRNLPTAQVVGRVQWIQRGDKVISVDVFWMKLYTWYRCVIDPIKSFIFRMKKYIKRKLL